MTVLSTLISPSNPLATILSKLQHAKNIPYGKIGQALAVLLVLANLKVVPFFWHGRFWYALYVHLLRRRRQLPTTENLFAPVVISSRSPLYECDFNLHKSNSTYFSDLDIARTHLVARIIKKSLAIRRQQQRPIYVALGGVSCHFKREIKPYEKYEVWCRVLGWDEKWFWVVAHFVSPKSKKIFATALSKYVFKEGRRTVLPEAVLEESGLLPPRPAGNVNNNNASQQIEMVISEGGSSNGSDTGIGSFVDTANALTVDFSTQIPHLPSNEPSRTVSPLPSLNVSDAEADLDAFVEGKVDKWDWETVQKLRKKGAEVARHQLALDQLEDEYEKANVRVGGRVERF